LRHQLPARSGEPSLGEQAPVAFHAAGLLASTEARPRSRGRCHKEQGASQRPAGSTTTTGTRSPRPVITLASDERNNCRRTKKVIDADQAGTKAGEHGRVVRIPLELDRRVFTPIARCSQKWKTAYARRTAVERVNSRIDLLLGFEHHTIRGKAKMKMRMGLALVVMLAMALGRIRAGQADLMRSMTAPVRRAA
jgi:hypothetical protein